MMIWSLVILRYFILVGLVFNTFIIVGKPGVKGVVKGAAEFRQMWREAKEDSKKKVAE